MLTLPGELNCFCVVVAIPFTTIQKEITPNCNYAVMRVML